MADEVYRWHGSRVVARWGVLRSAADGRWLPRLRSELCALRCGRRGHRYERPARWTEVLDDPPPGEPEWLNRLLLRRCEGGCGCTLVGVPDPLPVRPPPDRLERRPWL